MISNYRIHILLIKTNMQTNFFVMMIEARHQEVLLWYQTHMFMLICLEMYLLWCIQQSHACWQNYSCSPWRTNYCSPDITVINHSRIQHCNPDVCIVKLMCVATKSCSKPSVYSKSLYCGKRNKYYIYNGY